MTISPVNGISFTSAGGTVTASAVTGALGFNPLQPFVVDNTVVSVDNTITPTVVYSANIAGGVMTAQSMLVNEIGFDVLSNITNGTITFQAAYGGQVIVSGTTGNTLITANAAQREGHITIQVFNRGATNSQNGTSFLRVGALTGWGGNNIISSDIGGQAGTVDSTVTQPYVVTVTLNSATTAFRLNKKSAYAYVVKQ